MRLNKLLADCGLASRRHADEMITAGKVMIDGEIVTRLGTRVNPDEHRVEVDGVVLRRGAQTRQYYLLNKPSGVLCTNDQREARPRAVDLIADRQKGRIYTVGRLDEETIGLILLTTDGDFAHRITHPRFAVPKTYLVKVDGRVSDAALQKIREGIHLAEGKTAGARIVVRRRTDRQTTLVVTLWEGKNREVRRVFARVGWTVRALRRTHIGNVSDRGLKVGHWRRLTRAEVNDLLAVANGDELPAPAKRQGRDGGTGRGAAGSGRGGRGRGQDRRDRPGGGSRFGTRSSGGNRRWTSTRP